MSSPFPHLRPHQSSRISVSRIAYNNYNISVIISVNVIHVSIVIAMVILDQGSPNYGPRATSGPQRHFIRPAEATWQSGE